MTSMLAPIPGLIIDRTGHHGDDLSLAIIAFANDYGFIIGTDDEAVIYRMTRERSFRSAYESPNDTDHESLDELSEEAITWINEHATPAGYRVQVQENCLYLVQYAECAHCHEPIDSFGYDWTDERGSDRCTDGTRHMPRVWTHEEERFWATFPCDGLFGLFDSSAHLHNGEPTTTADEVTEHINGCAQCQDSSVYVTTDTDGMATVESY